MLHKTPILIFCLSLFFVITNIWGQQKQVSPYPLLNEKQNFIDAEDYFMNQADFVLAEQLYREVYNRLSPKNVTERAYVGLRLAFTLCNLNRQDEVFPLLENIEQTLPKEGKENELLLADLYTYRAKAFTKSREVDLALEWNDKAMVLKEKNHPPLHPKFGESYAVYSIIHNYYTRKMNLVSEYLELEKAIIEASPDDYPKYEQVALHYNLTSFYSIQGEYLKASTQGKKAIQLMENFKDLHQRYLANCYGQLGAVYLRMEDAEPAIKYLQESIKNKVITKKDSTDRAVAFTNLGYAYSLDGQFEEATVYFKKALGMYGEGELAYRAYSMNKLAEHYLNYPDIESKKSVLDSAYYYVTETVRLFEALYPGEDPNLSAPYMAMASYYEINEDFEKVLLYLQKSLINSVPNFDNKSPYSQPSLKESVNGYLTENILLKKAYAQYIASIKNNDKNALLYALSTNKLIDSLYNFKKQYFNDESSIINNPNIQKNYGLILEMLYHVNYENPDQKYIQRAFDYMERVKGNLILRNFSNARQSELFSIPDSLIREGYKIASDINSYLRKHPENVAAINPELLNANDTLFQLLENKNRLESIFKRDYPQYYQLRFQSSTIDIEKITQRLEGYDLIEFYWATNDIFILHLNSRKPEIYKIPIDKELSYAIDSHIKFLKENSKTSFLEYQKNAYELYLKLLVPIFKGKNPTKLIIVPDGPLAAIPFETLLTEKTNFENINYRDLPYLLHSTSISYAYSTNTLLQAYDKSAIINKPKLLAFSFSDRKSPSTGKEMLNQHGLFPLAGAAAEVSSLSEIIPKNRFKAFYGKAATKSSFFQSYSEYDLIHLALHAQSDHANRFNNRIYFHPTEENLDNENYVCFAHELYDLAPPPRLVVLGACNTGAGTNYTGEGTYSTARGFIYAGTPSVVMSLWPLSDQASKIINVDFYKEALNGSPLDEALREAKRSFIYSADEWTAHPSRWAALNVIGSTKPIVISSYPTWYWALVLLIFFIFIFFVSYLRKK